MFLQSCGACVGDDSSHKLFNGANISPTYVSQTTEECAYMICTPVHAQVPHTGILLPSMTVFVPSFYHLLYQHAYN